MVLAVEDRPECVMWGRLENKTVQLQNQGHANCITNSECTGFNCVGVYQDQPMNFGMRVLPCEAQPGVELFVNAPQFSTKNFSHVFSHDDKYDIPGSLFNMNDMFGPMITPNAGDNMRGKLEVSLKMDHSRSVMIIGLSLEACVNDQCATKLPILKDSEIPVPPCDSISSTNQAVLKKVNSVCSVSDLSGCGEHQVCEQIDKSSSTGICQCQTGFASQNDGACIALDNERIANSSPVRLDEDLEGENHRDKKAIIPAQTSDSKQSSDAPSGGAIAAAVISIIVVVVLITGAAFYIVMRTRLVPRIRARMTNTPYECANLSQPPVTTSNIA